MIHVIAVITAKPGKREEILKAFRANVPACRAEKGCIEYGPAIDAENALPFQTRIGAETFMVVEKQGDVMRMREVKGYEVPAQGSFELKPGGPHLMLVDIKRQLKAGEKVPLVLRFQNAGEVKAELEVRPLGGAPKKAHQH